MNQSNSITVVTVTSVPGNPVLNLDGNPSNRDIARAIAGKYGFQMQGDFPVPHSFCVVDNSADSEERPAVSLWCTGGHAKSRRWACACRSIAVTVTTAVGKPVLNVMGNLTVKEISRIVAAKFGFNTKGSFPVPHSFCVVDNSADSEVRLAVSLWRTGDHGNSRRWAGAH